MEKRIKYSDISLIGMELFRKNNETYMRSKLSPIMKKIFVAANPSSKIEDTETTRYMKSGVLPNRVFYIYSDELESKNPSKIFDIVDFNDNICIWFYSNNVINRIDKDPISTILLIYDTLVEVFRPCHVHTSFANTEGCIASLTMSIGFINFLHETYGALDMDKCKKDLYNNFNFINYKSDSVLLFIDDVLKNYNNESYFNNRNYLESYMLLERKETGNFIANITANNAKTYTDSKEMNEDGK